MASLSSIRSALNTHLLAVTALDSRVSIGRTAAFAGFPACRFYLIGVQEEKDSEDTANNYRVYVFAIDILMGLQVSGITKPASEATFQDAVDAVLTKLNQQWTLSGTVHRSEIQSSQVRYEEAPQGVMCYMQFVLHAKTLVSIV